MMPWVGHSIDEGRWTDDCVTSILCMLVVIIVIDGCVAAQLLHHITKIEHEIAQGTTDDQSSKTSV